MSDNPFPGRTAAAVCAFTLVTLAASLFWAQQQKAQDSVGRQRASEMAVVTTLPEGPMAQKAATACTECHDARIILQQRLGKVAWGKEVDKMVKWGAVVEPSDRDALIEYFSTNFGPDEPAYEPPRTSREKPSGRKSSK
jgi:hypothetical protein